MLNYNTDWCYTNSVKQQRDILVVVLSQHRVLNLTPEFLIPCVKVKPLTERPQDFISIRLTPTTKQDDKDKNNNRAGLPTFRNCLKGETSSAKRKNPRACRVQVRL